ncbi:tRNA-dihydrouridine synthase [Candidatus Woesearchaeota archaeon]|nr:tRNA-dihydrouridine synthase [Candidatus Woesearchaeota archaeon]
MKKINIGKVKLNSPTVVAPMEAVNSEAFLRTCGYYGAGLLSTQAMENLNNQFYNFKKTRKDNKLSFQMMVKNSEEALNIAKEIESDVDIIDFNFGCPLKPILGQKKGGYLLDFPHLIRKIVEPVINEVNTPITIKIRSGFDDKRLTYLQNGKLAEEIGVGAVTLHARTVRQSYTGDANWEHIKKLKEELEIPVIGNGDIFKAGHAKYHLEREECDGVMIGRGIKGNPGLFSEINQALNGEKVSPVNRKYQFNTLYKFFKEQETQKLSLLKDHAKWMTNSESNAGKLRLEIEKAKDEEEIISIFEQNL